MINIDPAEHTIGHASQTCSLFEIIGFSLCISRRNQPGISSTMPLFGTVYMASTHKSITLWNLDRFVAIWEIIRRLAKLQSQAVLFWCSNSVALSDSD